ncbi:hypothetical protein [Homoserinimonas sp. A520]
MAVPTRDVRIARVAFALAATTLLAGVCLITMYSIEVPRGGPYYFGAASDTLDGASKLLLAVLVVHLSRRLLNSAVSRAIIGALEVLTICSAAASFLLAAQLVPLEVPSAIAVTVTAFLAAWMVWLNGRLLADPTFPRRLARFGRLIGIGLIAGFLLVGVSLLLPWMSLPQLIVGGIGVLLGGSVWLGWPVWYLLVGRWLRPTEAAEAEPAAPVAAESWL